MSKLNLFQCLAASRPSYEDMFCVGRHIVRDLATCTAAATIPVVSPAAATAEVTPVAADPAVAAAAVPVTPAPGPQ